MRADASRLEADAVIWPPRENPMSVMRPGPTPASRSCRTHDTRVSTYWSKSASFWPVRRDQVEAAAVEDRAPEGREIVPAKLG